MAAKVIDVTLATIQNVGDQSVSPDGTILCKIVRAVDDEQVFPVSYTHLTLPTTERV